MISSSGVGGGVGGAFALIIIILIIVWACGGNPSTALAAISNATGGAQPGGQNINANVQQFANNQQLATDQQLAPLELQANLNNQMWQTAESAAFAPIV